MEKGTDKNGAHNVKTDRRNIMKRVKIYSLLMCMLLVLYCFISCGAKKSDNELIEERVETFLTAYNAGDMDTVLECLDAKKRNALEAMLNIFGGLAGSYAGFDISMKDLFSLGVNVSEDDVMELEITDIKISSKKKAIAKAEMELYGKSEVVYVVLVYEENDWYISDITDKKVEL